MRWLASTGFVCALAVVVVLMLFGVYDIGKQLRDDRSTDCIAWTKYLENASTGRDQNGVLKPSYNKPLTLADYTAYEHAYAVKKAACAG